MAKKILIADDEPNIVTALEFLLARGGYEVLIARDGDEALKALESARPDLVLLDIMMPVKSGYEICKRIRERPEWAFGAGKLSASAFATSWIVPRRSRAASISWFARGV